MNGNGTEKSGLFGGTIGAKNGERKKLLFVSVPMRDREHADILESIERMHRIAEAAFGEKLTVIDTVFNAEVLCADMKQAKLYLLGYAISKMASADYFIGVYDTPTAEECRIERDCAEAYGVEMLLVPPHIAAPEAYNKHDARISVNKEEYLF